MKTAAITGMVPVLGIRSFDQAITHYLDWLGFTLDWEWRAAPGQPAIVSITRNAVSLMLNEHEEAATGAWLTLNVDDLGELERERNERRPESAAIVVEAPYDIPTMVITDPFGNRLHFSEPLSAAENARRAERAEAMRAFIRGELDAGRPCPTPEAVVEACGRPPGLAMDVLGEFPEYGES
jgi:hypothetical protein